MENKRLLEAYAPFLDTGSKVYSFAHGEKADFNNTKKTTLATLLKNVDSRLTEAFQGSLATQRSNMGAWKKFCLSLTSVAIPSLIAEDLVIVHPLTSISGVLMYVRYVAGVNKGETKQGQELRNSFAMHNIDSNYTSEKVIERNVEVGEGGMVKLGYGRVQSVELLNGESGAEVEIVDAEEGLVKVIGATGKVDIAYIYDNVTIPQKTIATLVAKTDYIPLMARFRRIGIEFSQIAQYEATKDYGWDLYKGLDEQARAQLAYEIDTEIVEMLDGAAMEDKKLVFNATEPAGVNMADHYRAFLKLISVAKNIIYKRTQFVMPTYMVCAADVLDILSVLVEFKETNTSKAAGPYLAGTLKGIKVFVHPGLAEGRFFFGVNDGALNRSAGVFAPYMPVIPSSLTDLPDGMTIQGWATGYDCKILNKDLLVAGHIEYADRVINVRNVD